MEITWKLWSFVFVVGVFRIEARTEKTCFPKDFFWGVATASFQIEGAWNVAGKGESIWDRYTHTYPERVFDHTNADIAADSYHKFREDVRLLENLGVQFYRFSVSWPRILPTGFSNEINKEGLKYYSALIDELHTHNIQPFVTMYHWDLPQPLQELGGWTNPIMADYFVDYARVLFNIFGNKVKTWITFNEPLTFCLDGYGGIDAPGGFSSGLETYMCGHNVLRAHGMTYRMFDKEFRNKIGGNVGITLNSPWMEPATTSLEDQRAADIARQFYKVLNAAKEVFTSKRNSTPWGLFNKPPCFVTRSSSHSNVQLKALQVKQLRYGNRHYCKRNKGELKLGWFAHPIFSTSGDYPPVMRHLVDEMSRRQKFPRSRLPHFTNDEVKVIQGSSDFLGCNHYTTLLVSKDHGRVSVQPSFADDMGVCMYQDPDWPKSNSSWLRVVPWGFRKALNWIKKSYNNPVVVITENGISTEPGLQDIKRVNYTDAYLRALHAAIVIDGCNVLGYTHWSLIDNYEWMRGYSERFGLHEVDYTLPNRTRTPRLSAIYYGKIARTNCLPSQQLTSLLNMLSTKKVL